MKIIYLHEKTVVGSDFSQNTLFHVAGEKSVRMIQKPIPVSLVPYIPMDNSVLKSSSYYTKLDNRQAYNLLQQ